MSVSKLGHKFKPFHTSRRSIFALRPPSSDYTNDYGFTKWTLLTDYMKTRRVTRSQVRKFAHKNWIAVTGYKSRLYVCEICTEEINDYLGV